MGPKSPNRRVRYPGTVARQSAFALATVQQALEERWHRVFEHVAPRLAEQFGERLESVWLDGVSLGRDQVVIVVLTNAGAADVLAATSVFDADWRLDVQVDDAEAWESHAELPGFPQHRVAREGWPLYRRWGVTDDITRAIIALEELASRIVAESGKPGEPFDSVTWVISYLGTRQRSLGGVTPRSLLSTPEGRDLVMRHVLSQQSGAYW
jgi:hypothetical protein